MVERIELAFIRRCQLGHRCRTMTIFEFVSSLVKVVGYAPFTYVRVLDIQFLFVYVICYGMLLRGHTCVSIPWVPGKFCQEPVVYVPPDRLAVVCTIW